jgi:PhzF family phenazine biosynthesis protein
VKIYTVDAFTAEPFRGNPAGVCLLSAARDECWMQQVAREMNLSETAFLRPRADGFDLRWFTPVAEVELCGHATLASAHILWESGHLAGEAEARFHTLSGLLRANRRGDAIELDFPATPAAPAEIPSAVLAALGAEPTFVGRSRFDYLVEVGSEDEVRRLAPDFTRLKACAVRGIMVTSRAEKTGYDFVSRFFAPAFGVDEDPVTGSAHCCLAPHWSQRLSKAEMTAYQASPRGGEIRVRVAGDRVHLAGNAVTVIQGELLH